MDFAVKITKKTYYIRDENTTRLLLLQLNLMGRVITKAEGRNSF